MRARSAAASALTIAAVLLLAAAALAGDPVPPPARASVLVIERTPTGPVERTGYLGAFQYDGAAMLVDFTDDGDDALFHNGFDRVRR